MQSKLLLCALIALSFPGVSASGEADARILQIRVEDSHGWDCSYPTEGFCFFDVTGMEGGVGNATVDASQNLNYVGVATNFSIARDEAGGLWALPDKNTTFYASQHYAANPGFRVVVGGWQNATDDRWPSDEHYVNMTRENVTVACHCPGTDGGGDVTESRNRSYMLTPWGGSDCIRYEYVGPCNVVYSKNVEESANANAELMCTIDGLPCGMVLPVVYVAEGQTPNAVIGVQYHEAQVATDPSNLSRTTSDRDNVHSLAPSVRRQEGPPLVLLHRRGPPASDRPITRLTGPVLWHPATQDPSGPPRGGGAPRIETEGHAARPEPIMALVAVTITTIGFALLLLALGLYSRFASTQDLLSSPTRRRILDIVQANPGVHLQELARISGLTRQTISHHVGLLQRARFVDVIEDGWRNRLYPTVTGVPKEPAAPQSLPALRERVLVILRGAPQGLRRMDIQSTLENIPRRKRNKVLQQLIQAKLIDEFEGDDGEKLLRLPIAHVEI